MTRARAAARALAPALVAALALPACSYDFAAEAGDGAPPIAINGCVEDGDCGGEGSCVAGRCLAGELDYDAVLLEITVPASPSAGDYAGSRSFRKLTGLKGADGHRDVDVPRFSSLEVTFTPPPCVDAADVPVPRVGGECPEGSAPAGAGPACRYDFGQVPLELILTPTARALGIATERYSALSACAGDADCSAAEVTMKLPPGDYDAHVRPDPSVTAIARGVCDVVPDLATVTVPEDAGLALDFTLREPKDLPVEVRWSTSSGAPGALTGWSLDMVDGLSARRISNRVVLGDPTTEGEEETYAATLLFSPTPTQNGAATELVRLVPPAETVAPTVVVERASLGLFTGPAVLDQLTTLPAPVEVEGQLLARIDAGGTERLSPVGGTVTLIATALDGLPTGALAAFQRTVSASEQEADRGVFRATLLPGTYRVRVLPSGTCPQVAPCPGGSVLCECPLGATELDSFLVAPSPARQAGKTIELAWRTRVTGRAVTPGGAPVVGAPIQATAVPRTTTALATALGSEVFVPRASTGTVLADGSFELRADAGDFDVVVRPEARTGFAWLVRPGVPVEVAKPNLDLGALNLPLPVAFSGQVRVRADPESDGIEHAVLPGALLRAYLAVDSGTVVQVGEATANDEGSFELLLPERLESVR